MTDTCYHEDFYELYAPLNGSRCSKSRSLVTVGLIRHLFYCVAGGVFTVAG